MLLNAFSRVGKWLFWQSCAEGSLANAHCHTLSGKEVWKNRKPCALHTLFLTKRYTRTDTPWSPLEIILKFHHNLPWLIKEAQWPRQLCLCDGFQTPTLTPREPQIFFCASSLFPSVNKYTAWIRVHTLQIESNIQITANSVKGAWEWKDTTVPAGRVEASFTI